MFSHSCSWISRKVFKKGGGGFTQPLLRRQSSLTVRISGDALSEAGLCSPFFLVNIPYCCCHTGCVEFGFYAEIFCVIRHTSIPLIGQITNSLFFCSCISVSDINQDGFFGVYFLCTKTSACNWSCQCSLFQPRIKPNFWNYPQFTSAMYKINLKEMNIL